MSLPDTAEYWWDVKGDNKTFKQFPVHLIGRPCGNHYGKTETDQFNLVTCRKCKKTEQYKKLLPSPPPKCLCGKNMILRINNSTGIKFYGCSNYPVCKHTKSINNEMVSNINCATKNKS